MTELQLISFILLWLVLIVEGVLLFLLYRHVALLYAGRKAENITGLPTGAQAPGLIVRDLVGSTLHLDTLLEADRTIMIFGSFSCSPCRTILFDQYLQQFLTANSIPAYFITHYSQEADKEIEELSQRPRQTPQVVFADEGAFIDYSIKVTPFVYILNRQGIIQASMAVENSQELLRLWQQTKSNLTSYVNEDPIILVERVSGR